MDANQLEAMQRLEDALVLAARAVHDVWWSERGMIYMSQPKTKGTDAPVPEKADDSAHAEELGEMLGAAKGERAEMLERVLAVVVASTGVGLADVAAPLGLSKASAASALRTLKSQGRIHQGGEKRFARYASNPGAAQRASEAARGSKQARSGQARLALEG